MIRNLIKAQDVSRGSTIIIHITASTYISFKVLENYGLVSHNETGKLCACLLLRSQFGIERTEYFDIDEQLEIKDIR